MKNVIDNVKDFKIIPNNFKSSGEFELLEINDDNIKIKLNLLDKSELADYTAGSNVEVFGVNNIGLIYFETKITDINDDFTAHLALTNDYSIIQRREYSRVNLENGSIVFNDLPEDFVKKVEDISAGGVKLVTKAPLETNKTYSILINLSNNMKIECGLRLIRINETGQNEKEFTISGKFVNLENMDRVVLVQYAFKVKMEEQSKNDEII